MHDDVRTHWRKSSYSGNDSNCVELAWSDAKAGIRDSKAPETGTLTVVAGAYTTLLAHIKRS